MVDPVVIAVMVVLAVLTGLIFGLLPALQITRVPAGEVLKAGGRGVAGNARAGRVRSGLLAAEAALALVLLAGAGMTMQTFVRLQEAPLGFVPEGVFRLSVSLPRTRYVQPEARQRYFLDALDRIGTLPTN